MEDAMEGDEFPIIEFLNDNLQEIVEGRPGVPKTQALAYSDLLRFLQFCPPEDIRDILHGTIPALVTHIENYSSNSEGAINSSRLGGTALHLFKDLAELGDISEMIDLLTQAKSAATEYQLRTNALLNNLATFHQLRYKGLGDPVDMHTANEYLAQLLHLLPVDHLFRLTAINNLMPFGLSPSNGVEQALNLDQEIKYLNQAMTSLSNDRQPQPEMLNCLGHLYWIRFKVLEGLEDLKIATEYFKKALAAAISESPNLLAPILSKLSTAAKELYDRTGNLADLDLAISSQSRKIPLLFQGSFDELQSLGDLGIYHYLRYARLGETNDLQSTIFHLSRAVSTHRSDSQYYLTYHSALGSAYQRRYHALGHLTDSDLGIHHLSLAASRTSKEHPSKPNRLMNLGVGYLNRYNSFKNGADVDHAIESLSEAVQLIPDGHPDRPSQLYNLGESYSIRFKLLNQTLDSDRAIGYLSESVRLTPDDHSEKPRRLSTLGVAYHDLFEFSNDPSHAGASIDYVRRAALSNAGPARVRMHSAYNWALQSRILNLDSPFEGGQRVMDLLPQVVWLGSSSDKRYGDVPWVSETAPDLACMAIRYQKPEAALEWLEAGRSIVWNQRLQLRTPLDELSAVNESLAEELKVISLELDHTLLRYTEKEDVAQRHRRLAERRTWLIEQARLLPGLREFLRPKDASALVNAARVGAIAVITVDPYGCYALLIKPRDSTVSILQLQDLTLEKVKNAQKQLADTLRNCGYLSRSIHYWPSRSSSSELVEVLSMLWSDLVKPVLDYLGYVRHSLHPLPHITWCTTGSMSHLPIHAAGDYGLPKSSLFDYAISSYTPSLSALLMTPCDPDVSPRLLAIGQPDTPGQTPLPFATSELEQIITQANGRRSVTRIERESATSRAILQALESHSWVHFACHAGKYTDDSTSSAFLLHDGPLDLNVITQKQLKNADLAFLSACQTAAGDETLPDESIHLAAGMIMAGFKRVIATMWSIEDEDAPLVAEKFYAYMLDDTKSGDQKAAKALHYAIECLREKVGVKAFERWAPYIHIGL